MVSIFRKKAHDNDRTPKPPALDEDPHNQNFRTVLLDKSPPAIPDDDFRPATFAVAAKHNDGDAPCSTVTSFEDEDEEYMEENTSNITKVLVAADTTTATNDQQPKRSSLTPAPLMTEISNKARMRRLISGVVDKEYMSKHQPINNRRASEAPRQVTEGPTAKAFHKMTSTVACPGFQDEGAATELRHALQLRKLKTKQYD